MNMLERTQSWLEHLNKSECKVAETILASSDNAIHSNIATLTLETNVSEPTVNRFCCSMDTRGLPDFKLHLAQSLANGTPYANRNVNEDGSVELYTGKIFESAMAASGRIRHSLDKSVVNCAANLLTQTKKVAFLGLDSSAAVVHDAMNKLLRSNVPVVYSNDIVLQYMSYMNCSGRDVVVLIFHTGRIKNLVELAQLAHEGGAMAITLISTGTPLAREATLATTLDIPEDTDIYVSMVSRLAQLTMIDVLVTRFTLRRDTKFRDNLRRVKEALKEPRFDRQLLNLSDDR